MCGAKKNSMFSDKILYQTVMRFHPELPVSRISICHLFFCPSHTQIRVNNFSRLSELVTVGFSEL
ncbi:MAG: hypothetical protein DRI57_29995 [Deltaproteobacteria bacterium]|nr:MAG: hypothetical protein DRI57_29995 [Deltaproteobacteria bacterium]